MNLTNVGLINWHLYPLIDIDLRGKVIGLVGRNGVGKSTVLDAIQVVMTAGSESVPLNKRASVDKSSAKRSINDYCLGRIDEKQTLRDESVTYLILGFEDDKGIKPPVSLLLAFEAKKSESRPSLVTRMLVKGAVLKAEDVATVDGDQVTVESWYDCRDRVIATIKERGATCEELKGAAKEFIKEYMHALMYKNRSSNWKQFQKNFLNSIAFDRMGTVNDFVQKHVLSEDEIDIVKLRQSYTIFRELLADVKLVRSQIVQLEELRGKLASIKSATERKEIEQLIAALARATSSRKVNQSHRKTLNDRTAEHKAALVDAAAAREEEGVLRREQDKLKKEKVLITQEAHKTSLKGELAALTTQRETLLRPLLGTQGFGRRLHALLQILPQEPSPSAFLPDLMRLGDQVRGDEKPCVEAIPADTEEVDGLVASLKEPLDAYSESIRLKLEEVIGTQQKLKGEHDQLKALVSDAGANRVRRSQTTEKFLTLLGGLGIRAEVLCDVVEIADDQWRDAAESYLGRRREAIFVSPGECEFVVGLLIKNRREYNGVTVANTRKMTGVAAEPKSGTLNAVFATDHKFARQYLAQAVGTLQLADSQAEFDGDGRYITRDGLTSDGYSMSTRFEGEHRFGKAAMERNLATYRVRLNEIVEQMEDLSPIKERLTGVARILEAFIETASHMRSSGTTFTSVSRIVADIVAMTVSVTDQLELLEQVDTGFLDEQINSLESEIKALSDTAAKKTGAAEVASHHIRDVKARLEGDARSLGSSDNVDQTRQQYKALLTRAPTSAVQRMFLDFAARCEQGKSFDVIAGDAERARYRLDSETNGARGEAMIMSRKCLEALEGASQLPEDFDLLIDVLPWAERALINLRDFKLIEHEESLRFAEQESMEIFKTGYIHDIRGRFVKLDQEINAINGLLKHSPFLGEIYQIRKTVAPGYEAFHQVVKDIRAVEQTATGGGLLAYALDNREEIAAAMESVKGTIFNEDPSTNLDDYTDYRKYWVFDIDITNQATGAKNTFMSRKGTGSGGEQQTPYYIALMTALSNVYYGGPYEHLKKDEGGLCLAIFDEAFNNMDERVASQIVDFGRNLGLQLILCAPRDKKATMQRNSDTLLTVVKSSNGRQTSITPEYPTELARAELIAIDPSSKNDEELQRLMDERNAA